MTANLVSIENAKFISFWACLVIVILGACYKLTVDWSSFSKSITLDFSIIIEGKTETNCSRNLAISSSSFGTEHIGSSLSDQKIQREE